MRTLRDRERIAYIEGRTAEADLLGELSDMREQEQEQEDDSRFDDLELEAEIETLKEKVDELEEMNSQFEETNAELARQLEALANGR